MPYISVVMPTMRVGGLDIVCNGLANQNYKDFELIIADGIYNYRKDIVEERAKEFDFPIKHIEPFNNPFPNNAFCRYANSGLAYADCEVIVFITDYTYLEYDCLYKHSKFHFEKPNCGLMGGHQYYKLLNIHSNFEEYKEMPANHDGAALYHHSNDDTQKYMNDIKENKYNNLMWSLLTQDFDYNNYIFEQDPILWNADPKLIKPAGPSDSWYFHAKNESCGFKNLLQINGWNEILDGGHGYQDADIADRLCKFGGLEKWYVEPNNPARIINPRPIFPHGYRTREVSQNKDIWMDQCSKNYPITNNWNLREVNNLIKIKNQCDNTLKMIKF